MLPEELHPKLVEQIRTVTNARLLIGRAGPTYRTETQLRLREDHATAIDAVWRELDLAIDFPASFTEAFRLYEVRTQVDSKRDYLKRPDAGRKLSPEAIQLIRARSSAPCDIQFVIGDGLSSTAVAAQAPKLLPELTEQAINRGWRVGPAFLIRYCRVGVLNDLGTVLNAKVIVLLIGERPGLATARSLSAYMAYRPQHDHTDANRNLISNIHEFGLPIEEAAARILALANSMMVSGSSGVHIKDDLTTSLPIKHTKPVIES